MDLFYKIKPVFFINDEMNQLIDDIEDKIPDSLNANVRTIKRNFKVLIDNEIIEWIGSDKTGYWEVR